MEFMPQQNELPSVDNLATVDQQQGNRSAVEEELVAAIEIGNNQQEYSGALQQQQAPEPDKPIYFSDGTLYQSELNNLPSTSAISNSNAGNASTGLSDDQLMVTVPDNLLEIYNNLGLIGKLLTGGSLVTIKFIQAFRTFGESFVNILGITKPKYEYELNMAKQMQEAEAQRLAKLDQLYASWQTPHPAQSPPPTSGSSSSFMMPQPPPPIAPNYPGPYGAPSAASGPAVSMELQYSLQQPPPPPMMNVSPMSSPPPMQSLPSQQQLSPPASPPSLPPFPSPPQLTQLAYSAATFAPQPPQQ